jgi:hypothetical protein
MLFLSLLFIKKNKTSNYESTYIWKPWDKQKIENFLQSTMPTEKHQTFCTTCFENKYNNQDSQKEIYVKKIKIETLLEEFIKIDNDSQNMFIESVLYHSNWDYKNNNKIEPLEKTTSKIIKKKLAEYFLRA